ncbi:NADPH-dependent ferric siderophore reductase [Luteococcus japonicus]|uniref:NADPH-dependent ferric siderophore reductase n=1 Tax=Luteococcus japonicus TaxID=33984 RepID=A0A3N1ZYP3_9ACTN|nr:NADPH-dependent ferric siderophore reductase [Luteococcus japonicus]
MLGVSTPYESLDATVVAVVDLTPSIRRVTFRGPELARVHPRCLDRRIKLVLPRHAQDGLGDVPRGGDWYPRWQELDDRPPLRTYTARQVRPELGEVDVDMVRHGTIGPAGRWIENATPGDRLLLVVPIAGVDGGNEVGIAWHPGQARELLIAGDATAAPAIANILASLPPDATGTALLELPTSQDRYPLEVPDGITLRLLPCDGAAPGSRLEEALQGLAWPPECPLPTRQTPDEETIPDAQVWHEAEPDATTQHYAWLAGESSAITRIRRHLVQNRGCPRQCISFMGYWRAGRAES